MEERLTREYPITVLQRGSLYFAMIKELGIVEKSKDLQLLFQNIEKKKEKRIEEIEKYNLPFLLQKPDSSTKKTNWRLSLAKFTIACILCIIPLQLVLIPLANTLAKVNTILQKTMILHPVDFFIKLGKVIEKIPEEKKKELNNSLSLIGKECRHSMESFSSYEIADKEKLPTNIQ